MANNPTVHTSTRHPSLYPRPTFASQPPTNREPSEPRRGQAGPLRPLLSDARGPTAARSRRGPARSARPPMRSATAIGHPPSPDVPASFSPPGGARPEPARNDEALSVSFVMFETRAFYTYESPKYELLTVLSKFTHDRVTLSNSMVAERSDPLPNHIPYAKPPPGTRQRRPYDF